VAEQNTTKGAIPTGVLRSLAAYWWRTVTVLLGEVVAYTIPIVFYHNGFLLILVYKNYQEFALILYRKIFRQKN
jgi:hypothetical protein